jgi:hypothetical protein
MDSSFSGLRRSTSTCWCSSGHTGPSRVSCWNPSSRRYCQCTVTSPAQRCSGPLPLTCLSASCPPGRSPLVAVIQFHTGRSISQVGHDVAFSKPCTYAYAFFLQVEAEEVPDVSQHLQVCLLLARHELPAPGDGSVVATGRPTCLSASEVTLRL